MTMLDFFYTNLRSVTQLGPTFPLRHISRILGRKYHVSTIKRETKVYIRIGTSDSLAFLEVFQEKTYDLSSFPQFSRVLQVYQRTVDAGQIPIIIDAGANVGAASIWFSRQFPLARVLAVEPDASNAEICRLNTRTLPNVEVIEAAIGSEEGRVLLTNPANQAWMVQTRRSEDGNIPIVTIPALIRNQERPVKLFLVKIDIEGFESDLFAQNVEWVDDAEVIIIEPHDWLFPGRETSRNFQTLLAERRFELLIRGYNLIYVRLAC